MKRILFFVSIVLLSTIAIAKELAQIKVYSDNKKSTISYSMTHPLHSWTGVSNDFTSVIVTDESHDVISQVAVSVRIASFDSQNANRDSHAMEATEALIYPNVSFSSNEIKQEQDQLTVTGILKFHGVSKIITLIAHVNKKKNKAEITGGFDIKMTEFDIDPPSLMGIASDDKIKILFDVFY